MPDAPASPSRRARWLWWALAWVSLALGIIGAFLPVMPTTVFILIAAYAASRGSERVERWLLGHPRFGPVIANWRAHGAVPRVAKRAASWTMGASALVLLAVMLATGAHRWWMVAIPVACMAAVLAWLWRRPEPPPPPQA